MFGMKTGFHVFSFSTEITSYVRDIYQNIFQKIFTISYNVLTCKLHVIHNFSQKTLITDITYFRHGLCNLKALTGTEGRKTLMGGGGGRG